MTAKQYCYDAKFEGYLSVDVYATSDTEARKLAEAKLERITKTVKFWDLVAKATKLEYVGKSGEQELWQAFEEWATHAHSHMKEGPDFRHELVEGERIYKCMFIQPMWLAYQAAKGIIYK